MASRQGGRLPMTTTSALLRKLSSRKAHIFKHLQ